MFVWLQNAFQQCNKSSVAYSRYKSSYHLLLTLETEVRGGLRSVYKYHRTRWTYKGLRTCHFHWLQKDCLSSGHLKEQGRNKTAIKAEDIGASEKSMCSLCMQFMVGWSQREQLCEFSPIHLQRQKGLPPQSSTVKTLCFSTSSTYLGTSGPLGLIFLMYLLPLHHPSFLSYPLISQPNFYLLLLYNSPFFAAPPISFFILVSVLFLFLHTENCSPVSVLLLLLQILYLPFIPGLVTQSFFLEKKKKRSRNHVQHHSVHNSDSASAAPPYNWHFAIQNICKDIKQSKETSPNYRAKPWS